MSAGRRLTLAAVAAVVLSHAALLYACVMTSERVELPELSAIAQARFAAGNPAPIWLADATPFPWARVHVFPPYTSYEEVRDQVGFWPSFHRTRIDLRDDVTLLVFVRSDRVVAFALHPRTVDLAEIDAPREGLRPEQAAFRIAGDEEGGRWLRLALVDVRSEYHRPERWDD